MCLVQQEAKVSFSAAMCNAFNIRNFMLTLCYKQSYGKKKHFCFIKLFKNYAEFFTDYEQILGNNNNSLAKFINTITNTCRIYLRIDDIAHP